MKMLLIVYLILLVNSLTYVTSLHTPGCPSTITAAWWSHPPYTSAVNIEQSVFHQLVTVITHMCCDQSQLTFIERWENGQEMELDLKQMNDLLRFPISMRLDDMSVRDKYAKTIIPVIISPGAMYVALEKSESSDQITLILAKLWPLLVIMIISTGFAGIVMWALDCRVNTDHFSKSFKRGFPDGMWWAFISMTTVGYGDKTPRTLLAKAFGVVWIIAGICAIALLTSTITAALTTVTQDTTVDISNKNVAVLMGSEEKIIAFTEGAHVFEYSSISSLKHDILNGTVDGALLDLFVTFGVDKVEVKTSTGGVKVAFLDDLDISRMYDTPIVYGIQIDGEDELERCFSHVAASQRKSTYRNLSQEISLKKRSTDKDAGDYAAGIIGEGTSLTLGITISAGLLLVIVVTLIIMDHMYWKHKLKIFNSDADQKRSDSRELQVSAYYKK